MDSSTNQKKAHFSDPGLNPNNTQWLLCCVVKDTGARLAGWSSQIEWGYRLGSGCQLAQKIFFYLF
jgi:hypothetical protein